MSPTDQDSAAVPAPYRLAGTSSREDSLSVHLSNAEALGELGWWDWDVDADRLVASGRFSLVFDCPEHSCPSAFSELLSRVHPADRQLLVHIADGPTDGGKGVSSRYRILCDDGSERIIEQHAQILRNAAGRPVRVLAAVRDATDRAPLDLHAGADSIDKVTELPSRRPLVGRLQLALDLAEQHGRTVAVLVLDIDDFGRVNDSLGDPAGDALLREAATRLKRLVRKSDLAARDVEPASVVARSRGDEFIVLLTEVRQGSDAARVARRAVESLSRPYRIGQRELVLTVSVGVATYPDDASEAEPLLRKAHLALRAVKAKGGNGFQLFTESMNRRAQLTLRLDMDLRRALDMEEFLLHYQPKVSMTGGMIIGAEALLRWRLPDGTLIAPRHFIEACESSRLIIPLGRWALDEACRQLSRWAVAGFPNLRLAVNVSSIQFADPAFTRMVSKIIEDTRVNPSLLELELTESAVMADVAQSSRSLNELREMGLRVVLDDFGTGHSSLAVLKRLPLDAIKIDRSFVQEVPDNPRDVALVAAVVAMAQALGLQVVVEGVESEAQRDFFATIGCDEFQGYLVAKAMSGEQFLGLLHDA